MKNFKKIALGLIVGAMAIGFSAFTNTHKFTSVVYYQTSLNNYQKLSDPGGACDPSQPVAHPCTITYTSDKGSGFTWDTRPSGGMDSSTNEIYSN